MARLHFVETRDTRGRQASRRGIVLLFVLALLALFSLVTVTYVLVARQAKLGAMAASRVEQVGNTGLTNSQLDFGLMQVLRGTNSPNSVMGPHSLLEDMYGSDGVTGIVVNGFDDLPAANGTPLGTGVYPSFPTFNGVSQSQLVRFHVRFDSSLTAPLYQYDGAYNGRTITMLSGAAAGISSRVLVSTSTNITVPTLPDTKPSYGQTYILDVMSFGAMPSVGDRVLINGGAFNGTGFGFGFPLPVSTVPPTLYLGAVTNNSDLTYEPTPGLPYALLPNPVFFKPNKTDTSLGKAGITASVQPWYDDVAGPGGADESYDAADFQNMLLSLYVPDALVDATRSNDVPVPLPSLHRPELIFYWMVKSTALSTAVTQYPVEFPAAPTLETITPAQTRRVFQLMEYGDPDAMPSPIPPLAKGLVRRIMLRPWGGPGATADKLTDHPLFTGGNPDFNPCSLGDRQRWDVDNDQDGAYDSIWVDLGAPVQTAADGRKYKALYAVLVIDEDSKLNANAHGTLAHFDVTMSPMMPLNVRDATQGFRAGPYAGTSGSGLTPNATTGLPFLPMGQGYGPADINIRFLFDATGALNETAMSAEAGKILVGGTTPSGIREGRYGEVFGWTASTPFTPAPGNSTANIKPELNTTDPKLATGDWLDDFVRTADMSYDYFFASAWSKAIPPPIVGPVPPEFGSWGSPPDLNGDGVLGLDPRGMPWYGDVLNPNNPTPVGRRPLSTDTPVIPNYRYFAGFGEWNSETSNDKLDDPYEMILSVYHAAFQPSQAMRIDSPYSPAELERLRRFNDVDASSLGNRLVSLAPEAFKQGADNNPLDAARRRGLLTTETWDTPVPNTILPNDLILGLLQSTPIGYTPELTSTQTLLTTEGLGRFVNSSTSGSFNELVRRRLAFSGFDLTNHQQKALSQLVSWDLARGEPLDLNRLLGTGVDDDNDKYIDSPTEAANGDRLWGARGMTALGVMPFMDHNNDGVSPGTLTTSPSPSLADKSDYYARQLLARHLYILAWTIVDPTQSGPDTLGQLVDNTVTVPAPQASRATVAKRLAQWAVNMVDFRDRDSVMTAFEYDIYPFSDETTTPGPDGFPWDVDDDPKTDPSGIGPLADTLTTAINRGVVWGCERPELLITETGAFHNRRVVDDTVGGKLGVMMGDDSTLDQKKRPLGSLFVELYAPWNQTEAPAPELYFYDTTTSTWQVKLSAKAPDGSPVWRMVTSKDIKIDEYPEKNEWNGPAASGPNTAIDRTVYFIPDPGATPLLVTDHQHPYFRPTAATGEVLIPANTYLVIGPTEGTQTQETMWDAAVGAAPATANITFTMLTTFNMTGGPTYPTSTPIATAQIKPPVPLIINSPRRLSISEPYPGDTAAAAADAKYTTWDGGSHLPNEALGTSEDMPWDNLWTPAQGGISLSNGTNPDVTPATDPVRIIFLQRLADPTRNWDRKTNPYLTVDRMPVDLTIYNSETNVALVPPLQPDKPYNFGTRQRGKLEVTVSGATTFNIWSNYPCQQPAVGGPPSAATFSHTLGYLNDASKLPVDSPSGASPAPTNPMRLVNGTPGTGEVANTFGDAYVGGPSTPFPWLTWNNRPYISKHELLLVPATAPHELLIRHSARHLSSVTPFPTTMSAADKSPYLLNYNVSGVPLGIFDALQFGYVSPLMVSNWVTLGGNLYSLPNFHRLLEFVTVPSRFGGTEIPLDPTMFAAGSPTAPSGHHFNPPFNRISTLREPGKVNINTVTDIKVWQGIMNQLPDGSPMSSPSSFSWQKLTTSRRGFGPNAGTLPIIDPTVPLQSVGTGQPLPTFFANPFRSYGGLYLVPIPELQTSNFNTTSPSVGAVDHLLVAGAKWLNEIDTTLLRVDQNSFGAVSGPSPLFAQNPTVSTDITTFADALANPYFRYQNIQKLSNLVTTRSNVYSVWITVGYFEVNRVPADGTIDPPVHPSPLGWQGHPDGWELGAEMGLDSGKVERHRAFYIIDRSLPVAFQRGQDNNVDNAVLLRRVIE